MRAEATGERIRELLTALGADRRGGRLHLSGGACAVLVGWRESTIDVDIRLDHEWRVRP